MSEALYDALNPVIVRWTMGGAAADLAPEGIRGHLGEDADEAELCLLAIAGQALGTLAIPEPAGGLEEANDLPALDLPTIPDRLRPTAARVLSEGDSWLVDGLVWLLHSRGRVTHPSDWMPSGTRTIPDVYAPWRDWIEGARKPLGEMSEQDAWDNTGQAGRIAILKAMRSTDPDKARAVIEAKAGSEPADKREAIVSCLSVSLGAGDAQYLRSLSSDRSPRVRATASRMLAKIGYASTSPGKDADQHDVTDLMRIEAKGIFNRKTSINLVHGRNAAKRMRLHAAMEALSAADFAGMLKVEPERLPALWAWGADVEFDTPFASMLLSTGTDAVASAVSEAVRDGADVPILNVGEGLSRLSDEAVSAMIERQMSGTRHLVSLATATPVHGRLDSYKSSSSWRSISKELQDDVGVKATACRDDLHALGLLVTSRAAKEIMEWMSRIGIPSADPRLDTLRINAAL
jgi:hypothetical protein